MKLSLQQWHERFQQQAAWTASLRAFLFSQVNVQNCRNILEVGCGTGVLTAEIQKNTRARIYGLDLDGERCHFAAKVDANTVYVNANAEQLPFSNGQLDLVFCHYLLLWLREPVKVLREMARVSQPGARILALAEPDYLSRIDFPAALQTLAELQTRSLTRQGASVDAGRHLAGWFTAAGLQDVQFGVSGFQATAGEVPAWFDSEWETLQADLNLPQLNEKWSKLKELDRDAWQKGERVLWIPTFYAIGTVPDHSPENSLP